MKKSIVKAFTLVELIIVIAIITLISSSSVFYFLDFVKNQEINQRVQLIEDNLKKLDKDIKKYNIFDYELVFNTSNSNWAYITYINKFDNHYIQNLSLLNTNTLNWTISIWWAATSTWILKVFRWQKLFLNKIATGSTTENFTFDSNQFYKIKATMSWKILNEIYIDYYSIDNIDPKRNNLLNLVKISDTLNWTDLWTILVQNIWWKKIFKNWATEYSEIFLHFESSWKEKFIKITK